MPHDDDDEPKFPVLAEDEFDRLARVKELDDAALLRAYRLLSNPRVIDSSPWLPFLEAEIRIRGLMPLN